MNFKCSFVTLTIVLLGLTAKSQDNRMWVDRETYRRNVSDLVRLRFDSALAEQLKVDTFMLRRTIQLKDNAFRMLMEQVNLNKQVVDTLSKIKGQQADIIASQDEAIRLKDVQIDQLNKHKVTVWRQIIQVFAGIGAGVLIGKFK